MAVSTRAAVPMMPASRPSTTRRATETRRSDVLDRTEPTSRSMVSAVCTAQSPSRAARSDGRVPAGDGRASKCSGMAGAYPWPVRRMLALVAGLLVTALGAAILGEYQFNGLTGVVAGLIFGLFVAEVTVSVAREGNAVFAVVCAAFTVGGLGWAVHASIGPRGDVPALAW